MTAIKERPINFSAPMVRAILEGRKTVTRRPVKATKAHADGFIMLDHGKGWWPYNMFGDSEVDSEAMEYPITCPYGKPGDRLWVRESWWQAGDWQATYPEDDTGAWFGSRRVFYSADGTPPNEPNNSYPNGLRNGAYSAAAPNKVWRHRPSIHMDRWASRILLEIADVRVERLQASEGETAFESRYVAEGIHRIHHGDGAHYFHPFKSEPGPGNWADPFDAWRELWVSINGADSWNANTWVWVVEFKQVTP
ncbi:hypothetical protein K9857_04860 [Pseudomonas sp. REP124]|uniref:hypothetical protein n=1 Tax=Pseudomonas sp. REP124 TaxID=2875731 RepID=UPI001CCCDB73|nr:hypothetical protein [Pseudomonas sp. REP124]MBZ9780880.1 hypothetical protein [Pseudomonas sp. REP124]